MRFTEYLAQVRQGDTRPLEATVVPRQARRVQGQSAGLASRLIAAAVDIALIYLLMRAVDLALRTVDVVATPWFNIPIPTAQTFAGIGVVTLWAYATWAWAYLGRTLGDHVMGLRVVDRMDDRLGVKRAALRSLASVAFPLGTLWVPFSRQGRSLQDILLRTEVIYDWVNRASSSPLQSQSPSHSSAADS